MLIENSYGYLYFFTFMLKLNYFREDLKYAFKLFNFMFMYIGCIGM